MKLLDKNLFFCPPPPPKKVHCFSIVRIVSNFFGVLEINDSAPGIGNPLLNGVSSKVDFRAPSKIQGPRNQNLCIDAH